MKPIILSVLLLYTTFIFGQEKEITYNNVVSEYVLSLWKNDVTTQETRFQVEELDQLKSFLGELKKQRNHITATKFLSKPTANVLVGYYLFKKLKWNSFNGPHVGLKKLAPEVVINKQLKNLPSKHELLTHYYLSISADILNKQRPLNLASLDIDFKKLNLNTNTEKAILFLSFMRHLGGQITSYAVTQFPNNCFRAKKYVKQLPKFDGKSFNEFKLPHFKDFKIEVDKRYPKMSFKRRYIPEFKNAKMAYKRCLEEEKN